MKSAKVLFLKKIILVVSVYFIWTVILKDPQDYNDYNTLYAIPFTIISIYIWKILNKKNNE